MNDYRGEDVDGALLYLDARQEADTEAERRSSYDTMMLYMIAQPTRKEPERLPRYEDLYEERLAGYGKTGEEILLELING